MLRPCQWLEGTDIIKAAAPRCGEWRGNPRLVTGSGNTDVLVLSENEWTLSNSWVRLLASGCYERMVWSLWFNVRACKCTLSGNLLVLCTAEHGHAASTAIGSAAGRSLQRGRASAFVEGQEKGGAGKYVCACQDNEFLLTAFCSLAFLAKSQLWGLKQIFSMAFFVFLDRNILISYWWCAFENTSVGVPPTYLKYFKAAEGFLPGNSSDSHHTYLFRGVVQQLDLGRKCYVCTHSVC